LTSTTSKKQSGTNGKKFSVPVVMAVGLGAMAVLLLAVVVAAVMRPSSPTAVVKSFYMAANDGKYSEAVGMLSKNAKDNFKGSLGQITFGGFKGTMDIITKHGSITSIEPVSEAIRGEGATVVVTIHFKDGSKREKDKTSVIWEDGRWRIGQ
jgi:hypothetical protein